MLDVIKEYVCYVVLQENGSLPDGTKANLNQCWFIISEAQWQSR